MYVLWIYVGHIYLLRIGEKVLQSLGISLNLFTALLLAALYCGLLTGLGWFMSRQVLKRTSIQSLPS